MLCTKGRAVNKVGMVSTLVEFVFILLMEMDNRETTH